MGSHKVECEEDHISPSGFFNGDYVVTVTDRETGEKHQGRGHTPQSAERRARRKFDEE